MRDGGITNTDAVKKEVRISWGFCELNIVTQVIEYYYNLRKKN